MWWQILLIIVGAIFALGIVCAGLIWIFAAIMQHKFIDRYKQHDPNY